MTYAKQTWTNGAAGATPLSAARLNHIEDGLDAADSLIDSHSAGSVSVKDPAYGAIGDGVTDDRVALNAALSAAVAASGTLILPPGNYRITTAALTAVTGPLTILGYGATITQATTGVGVLSITGSRVQIRGLRIVGPDGTGPHASTPKAISVTGTSAAVPASRVRIIDCEISGFNGYGIYAKWAHRLQVYRCDIYEMWHAGVLMLSCTRSAVIDCDIAEINNTANAYGIIASRSELGTTLDSDPRSSDITISGCRVSGIPSWEGIDTHAGERISIVGNTITGCKIGVAVGGAQDTTNTLTTYAPLDCVVAGNLIDSGVTDGSAGAGVAFTGAADSDERATGAIVGNVIKWHGTESSTLQGGIYAHTTDGLAITGNTLTNCSPVGIAMYHTNRGFTVAGNTVTDVWTTAAATATCINLASTNNVGTIGNNTFNRGSLTGKAIIGGEGIRVANSGTNSVAAGPNQTTMTTYVVDAGRTIFAMLGRARSYASTGSPEGVVTAAAGSFYQNLNGGAGTTLYVKESGSGNTGWVAK